MKSQTIANVLSQFEPIKNRLPFVFKQKVIFVNQFFEIPKSKTAIRKILLNPYYKFNYKNVEREIYAPVEVKNELEFVSSLFEGGAYYTGHTLKLEMRLTTQHENKNLYIAFGKPNDQLIEIEKNPIFKNVVIFNLETDLDKSKIIETLKIKQYEGSKITNLSTEECSNFLN